MTQGLYSEFSILYVVFIELYHLLPCASCHTLQNLRVKYKVLPSELERSQLICIHDYFHVGNVGLIFGEIILLRQLPPIISH